MIWRQWQQWWNPFLVENPGNMKDIQRPCVCVLCMHLAPMCWCDCCSDGLRTRPSWILCFLVKQPVSPNCVNCQRSLSFLILCLTAWILSIRNELKIELCQLSRGQSGRIEEILNWHHVKRCLWRGGPAKQVTESDQIVMVRKGASS